MEKLVYLQGAIERMATVEEVVRNIVEGHWYCCDAPSHILTGDYGDAEVFVYHKA